MPVSASPSPLVIGFAFALSLLTGVLFGLAPALMAARTRPAEALRSNSRTTAHGASFLQRGLVVLQAALSLVLLVAAGLFAQSLTKAENVNMNLDTTNRYIVHIIPREPATKPPKLSSFTRLSLTGSCHSRRSKVGVSTYTPMEANDWNSGVKVQGDPNLNKTASWVKATPEYFDAVGTHLVMGRGFTLQDTMNAPPVAVVNQEFVKQFFGKRNPIGIDLDLTIPFTQELMARMRSSGSWKTPPTQASIGRTTPCTFFLSRSLPAFHARQPGPICVRGSYRDRNHATLFPGLKKIVGDTLASINPSLTILKFQTFRQQTDDRFTQERLISRLTSLSACWRFCSPPSDSMVSLHIRWSAAHRRSGSAWHWERRGAG